MSFFSLNEKVSILKVIFLENESLILDNLFLLRVKTFDFKSSFSPSSSSKSGKGLFIEKPPSP